MHLTIMTSMFFHALESLCSNYSVSSIFRWCFIIAKRKEKRTQCEQEGKALHEKKKRQEREILLGLELLWRKPNQVSQSKWSQGPALMLAKCQEKAMSKGHDTRLKRSLAWWWSIRRSDAGTVLFPFPQGDEGR